MEPSDSKPERRPRRSRKVWLVILALVLIGSGTAWIFLRPGRPIEVNLADGRVLVIEGVTYGTVNRIGQPSRLLDRFRPWLPASIYKRLAPKHRLSTIELDRPAMVVWINALNPTTRTNVDCQMLRFECVSSKGDVFDSHPHWYGDQDFWRVGHVFNSWPRDESRITVRITPYRTNQPSQTSVANPHLTYPASWKGEPLPQTRQLDDGELVLSGLDLHTNVSRRAWDSPAIFWEPAFEFRYRGEKATGWSRPEWEAEDPLGNHGQRLGIHQPILKFQVTVYPDSTNSEVAKTVALLPAVDLGALQTNLWWNLSLGSSNLVALGVCPAGVWSFSAGQIETNPVSRMGPVRGGAPSGWTSARKQVNPLQVKTTNAHYTDRPTIYIRATELAAGERLGLRVRDDQGRIWAGRPEGQGAPGGVHAFLLDIPAGVTNITPEIAILKPLRAEFYVQTQGAEKP